MNFFFFNVKKCARCWKLFSITEYFNTLCSKYCVFLAFLNLSTIYHEKYPIYLLFLSDRSREHLSYPRVLHGKSQESGVSHLLYMSGPGSDERHGVAGVGGGHDQGGGAGVNPDGPRCFHRLWAVDGSVEVVFPTVIIINVKRLKKKPRTCLKIITTGIFLPFCLFQSVFLKIHSITKWKI